jgi:hypothetical protein
VTERAGDRHAMAAVQDVVTVLPLDHGDRRQRPKSAVGFWESA